MDHNTYCEPILTTALFLHTKIISILPLLCIFLPLNILVAKTSIRFNRCVVKICLNAFQCYQKYIFLLFSKYCDIFTYWSFLLGLCCKTNMALERDVENCSWIFTTLPGISINYSRYLTFTGSDVYISRKIFALLLCNCNLHCGASVSPYSLVIYCTNFSGIAFVFGSKETLGIISSFFGGNTIPLSLWFSYSYTPTVRVVLFTYNCNYLKLLHLQLHSRI